MAVETRGACIALTPTEAMSKNLLVTRTTGKSCALCTAADVPVGSVDNDDIDVGDESVTVRLFNDVGTRKLVAASAIAADALIYPAAAGKIDDDGSAAHGRAIGISLEAASGDLSVIECLTWDLGAAYNGGALHFSELADSTTDVGDTAENDYDLSATIDGATLEVGDVLEILATVVVEDNNSTDTLAVKLYLAGQVIVAPAAFNAADADIVQIHAFVTIVATGAGGSVRAHGSYVAGVPGTAVPTAFVLATAAEDLSGSALAIKASATWSVSHADNESHLAGLTVIHHKK